MTPNEKVKVFEKELELILDPSIKEFVRLCIIAAPDYVLYDCPSSSSGKWHPVNELGGNGNVVHIKKMVTMLYEVCIAFDCGESRDEILAAGLIHDLRKQGLEKSGHTVSHHPELAAQLVEEVQRDTQLLTDESYRMIRSCVGYHYGVWSEEKWKKPLTQYTPEELTVYITDVFLSKRYVDVDYRR